MCHLCWCSVYAFLIIPKPTGKTRTNPIADDDPVTGDRKCCTRLNEKFTVDKVVKTQGGCCKPPLVYAYDPVAKAGKCCGSSQTFKDGECIPPFPLPPKCAPCSKNYVCACDGDLGLQYGHCYTMTDVNGLQFNRAVDGTYQSGGDIGNLIFRVSKFCDNGISDS